MSQALNEFLALTSKDPLAFVMGAFPWGEGSLAGRTGPEGWQRDLLEDIRDGLINLEAAVRLATSSGHGVGKSCVVAWLILWAISTFPDTRGVVTANTEAQLKTKTWAELGKWFQLFVGRDEFCLTATAIYKPERERTWRIDMIPWSEKSTEAFAGMHNLGKRILVIFDEGSAIMDRIWEVTEGALTDAGTQIIWAVFGNPTKNTGRFRECFPGQRFAKDWKSRQVDSRTISFTDKEQIARWIKSYGDDSDFIRVRVKGEFPRTGMSEFISASDVDAAASEEREPSSNRTDPLVIGVDVARYGSNESVIFFRRGRDARSLAPLRYRGLDTVGLAMRVSEVHHEFRTAAIFVDEGGVGGGVVDNLRALGIHCYGINFGSKPDHFGFATGSDGERYANKRAEMWGMMRAWLKGGAIPDEPDLKAQLVGPTYTYNLQNEILLEKKEDMVKRGLESPDLADALALTFAMPVASKELEADKPGKAICEYNPFDAEHMAA